MTWYALAAANFYSQSNVCGQSVVNYNTLKLYFVTAFEIAMLIRHLIVTCNRSWHNSHRLKYVRLSFDNIIHSDSVLSSALNINGYKCTVFDGPSV